jgi:hypothetical protein
MVRPDEDRFCRFSRHLEAIDDEIGYFCREHHLQLQKNLNRQPCRVLRSSGNPQFVIDLYLEGHWLSLDYREDLPHSVGVAAYYQPAQGKRLVRRATVAERLSFSELRPRLGPILEESLALLKSWPVPASVESPESAPPGWERTRS